LLAGWRLSLRRTRADWPIVAAAWLITLLATVLFAAGPIYSSAASLAGLRRTLADAPPADTSVQVAVYGTPEYLTSIDGQVADELRASLGPLTPVVVREGRAAATLGLPPLPSAQDGDRAAFGFLDGVPDNAALVAGAWPAPADPSAPLEVVVAEPVASTLQLSVGQQLDLQAPHAGQPVPLPVRVVGVYAVNDPADPFWYGDEQLSAGIVESGNDRTFGPFLTAPDALLKSDILTSIHLHWRAFPDFDGLTVDNVAGVHTRLDALGRRLPPTEGGKFDVATGLPEILGGAEKSLLVSRTEMLLLMAQLAVMAAYAIALTATLLVDHRRVETALLRSRGAGPRYIAWLAFVEGLLIVVPTVLLAPWLALAEATILNVYGPLADIGLAIEPTVTTDSYALAVVAGLICLALLVLPAFFSARSFASEERDLSRQETRTFGQRLGLDIVLLAVSAIALWQLRLYGAPLTQTVQGSLGFDPLLVAAPAIGLLAGGILALRVLPLLAAAFEHWVSRGREVVASLGSRQLARRPLRYTRTALLLILAMSLGVFAVSYASTWSGSQHDQATYQSGADVRAAVNNQPGSTPMSLAAYSALPGVTTAMPVERLPEGLALASGVDAVVLGMDADTAGSVVHFRADESDQPLGQMLGALRNGRPSPALTTLPADAAYLKIDGLLDITRIVILPNDFSPEPEILAPSSLTDVKLRASAFVRDAHGDVHRMDSAQVTVVEHVATLLVPLGAAGVVQPGTELDGPLELAAIELDVMNVPTGTLTTEAQLGVTGLSTGSSADGPWTEAADPGWAVRMAPGSRAYAAVDPSNANGMVVSIVGGGNSVIEGGFNAARVAYVSNAVDTLDATVPVIANPAFLAAAGSTAAEPLHVSLDNFSRTLQIVGTVNSCPTTDPTKPLLVIDKPTLELMRLQANATARNADEWWMAAAPDSSDQIVAALRADPFDSASVVSASARTRSLTTDPVALGIIGALLLGFVATGIFALVALVVSAAVSARQRRTEFALLRALGLSGGQLSRWLWLENGSLVLVSLICGTAVGAVMSWIALPFITVTQQATTPVPGVLVELPWDRILLLDVIVVIALGIAVGILAVVLRRIGVGSILRLGED
jgi:ABC-type lipoprotein release transport system permease subunit